jgi:hypothetical protein
LRFSAIPPTAKQKRPALAGRIDKAAIFHGKAKNANLSRGFCYAVTKVAVGVEEFFTFWH